MESRHRDGAREPAQGREGAKAELAAEDRVIDALCGPAPARRPSCASATSCAPASWTTSEIEIEVADSGGPMQFEVPGQPGASVGMINIGDMLGKAFGGRRTKKRKMTVAESHATA